MVTFEREGRVADSNGVDFHSDFVDKPTDESQALGKIISKATADTNYSLAAAGATGDFAMVMKDAETTAPRVEVLKTKSVRVTKKVGATPIPPHDYCQVGANNELVPWDETTVDKIVGQYNQHAETDMAFADAQTSLPTAAAGDIIYIDWLVRPGV